MSRAAPKPTERSRAIRLHLKLRTVALAMKNHRRDVHDLGDFPEADDPFIATTLDEVMPCLNA